MNKFKLFETKNYGQFTTIESNRNIKPSNIKKLTQSIKNNGLMYPILVDSKLNVIDGQHRLDVLIKLQLPVPYIVNYQVDQSGMIEVNNIRESWKTLDYIKNKASEGNIDYVLLYNKITEYSKEGTYGESSISSAYCVDLKYQKASLVRGAFKFDKDKGDNIISCVNRIYEELGAIGSRTRVVYAINRIYYENPNFSVDRLLNSYKKGNIRFNVYSSSSDIIKEILEVYNRGLAVKNRIFV